MHPTTCTDNRRKCTPTTCTDSCRKMEPNTWTDNRRKIQPTTCTDNRRKMHPIPVKTFSLVFTFCSGFTASVVCDAHLSIDEIRSVIFFDNPYTSTLRNLTSFPPDSNFLPQHKSLLTSLTKLYTRMHKCFCQENGEQPLNRGPVWHKWFGEVTQSIIRS